MAKTVPRARAADLRNLNPFWDPYGPGWQPRPEHFDLADSIYLEGSNGYSVRENRLDKDESDNGEVEESDNGFQDDAGEDDSQDDRQSGGESESDGSSDSGDDDDDSGGGEALALYRAGTPGLGFRIEELSDDDEDNGGSEDDGLGDGGSEDNGPGDGGSGDDNRGDDGSDGGSDEGGSDGDEEEEEDLPEAVVHLRRTQEYVQALMAGQDMGEPDEDDFPPMNPPRALSEGAHVDHLSELLREAVEPVVKRFQQEAREIIEIEDDEEEDDEQVYKEQDDNAEEDDIQIIDPPPPEHCFRRSTSAFAEMRRRRRSTTSGGLFVTPHPDERTPLSPTPVALEEDDDDDMPDLLEQVQSESASRPSQGPRTASQELVDLDEPDLGQQIRSGWARSVPVSAAASVVAVDNDDGDDDMPEPEQRIQSERASRVLVSAPVSPVPSRAATEARLEVIDLTQQEDEDEDEGEDEDDDAQQMDSIASGRQHGIKRSRSTSDG